MKRTQRKDAWRNIWKQKVSYLSIMVIALLGVTAYLGINYSAVAMKANGSAIYNELRYRDMEVISTRLLSAEDLECLRRVEGVLDAEPVWQTGANAYVGDTRESVTVITITDRLNRPILQEGRLPEQAGECAIEKRLAEETGWCVGDVIDWLEMTEETGAYFFSGEPYTITGIADHPDHTSLSVPDTLYVLVSRDAFDHETLDGCCMKALVAVDAADANRFTKAYSDSVAVVADRIERIAPERAALRDEQVRRQTQEQIDEFGAALRDAKQELDDGRAQVDEGWQKLAEAEQQLTQGKQELDEAKAQLEDYQKQLTEAEQQLQEARTQLDEAKEQLEQGKQELQSGNAQLGYARRQLEDGWEELEDAKESVRSSLRSAVRTAYGAETSEQIDWAEKQPANVNSNGATAKEMWITTDTKVDMDGSWEDMVDATVSEAVIPDETLRRTYDSMYANDPNPPEYDPEAMRAHIKLTARASAMASGAPKDYDQLADGCAQWDDGHDQYMKGYRVYDRNKDKYNEAVAAYEQGEQEYAEGLAAYEEGLAQFADGQKAYEQGLTDLEAGRKEIASKRKELEEAEEKVADGLSNYAYGEEVLNDAQAQLDAMDPSRWIILDDLGNASFAQLNASSDNLSSLQMTFSLLFVVLGALVIYATVSKMVDEQRTLVGATKALGFYNGEVFAKYLLFGLSATALGAILGILMARFLIEDFVLTSYNIYFSIDFTQSLMLAKPTLIVLLGGVLLAVAAVTFACMRLVRTPAIQLMQAPVPKGRQKTGRTGKHLLSLYSRLVLLNIRTDIRRVLVTVVSVAGCCALMVIGFTLKYAMDKCVENQYTDIVAYDGRITHDYAGDIEEKLRTAGVEYVSLFDENVTFRIRDMEVGELFCGDMAAIGQMYHLNDWNSGEPLAPTDEGIFVQRRLAEMYDLTVGSEIELTLGGVKSATVRVAGIFENYIGRTMVMSPACYRTLFGDEPTYNAFFVRFGDVDREALLAELSDTMGFVEYTPSDADKAMFEASTSVINAVVALFILMAAVMAGVVLLNLTNIYIMQKNRELTIMRINGFTTGEVISYVTRETVITTVLGIVLGLLAGSAISYRIVRALEQAFVRMERGICFSGWLYAAAMTVFFTVVVNVVALRKVKRLKLTDVA